jgi:hypothetical protein
VSDILRKTNFADKLHTKFRLRTDDSNYVELELTALEDGQPIPGQEQFSLMFKGPLEFFLPQSIYQFEHEGMGTIEIFLVPIEREKDGYLYEAAFSLMTD